MRNHAVGIITLGLVFGGLAGRSDAGVEYLEQLWVVPGPEEFESDVHKTAYTEYTAAVESIRSKGTADLEVLGERYMKAVSALAERGDDSAAYEKGILKSGLKKETKDPSSSLRRLMDVRAAEKTKIATSIMKGGMEVLLAYSVALEKGVKKMTASGEGFAATTMAKELRNEVEPRLKRLITMEEAPDGFLLPGQEVPKNIPDDAKTFEGHRYKAVIGNIGFHAAQAKCEKDGGHLVIVDTEEEQKFIEGLYELELRQGLWIGAFREEEAEKDWTWVNGEPLDKSSSMYSRMRRRTSRDAGEKEVTDGLDFLMLYRSGTTREFHWLTHYSESGGSTLRGYICEWED